MKRNRNQLANANKNTPATLIAMAKHNMRYTTGILAPRSKLEHKLVSDRNQTLHAHGICIE